jgi:hypothetical protein
MIAWPVAQGVAAAVGVAAATVKWRDLRANPTNATLRHIVVALVAATTAIVLSVPQVFSYLDRLVGVRNLAYWLLHALALYGVYHVQVVALLFTRPDKAAHGVPQRRLVWIATAVAMAGLLMAGPVPEAPSFAQLSPELAAFELLWAAYLLFSFTDLARMCLRYVPHAGSRTGRSLKLLALGGVLVDCYATLRAAHVGAALAGSSNVPGLLQLEGTLIGLAMVVLVSGVTWSAWWKHVDAAARQLRCYRSWRAVVPLWNDIHNRYPEIALGGQRRRSWTVLLTGEAEFCLYRTVIEIHDGMLLLRPLLSIADEAVERSRAQQQGLSGPSLDVAVTAGLLRTALAREDAGSPHQNGEGVVRFPIAPPGLDNLQSEAAWLGTVARSYATCKSIGQYAQGRAPAEVRGG